MGSGTSPKRDIQADQVYPASSCYPTRWLRQFGGQYRRCTVSSFQAGHSRPKTRDACPDPTRPDRLAAFSYFITPSSQTPDRGRDRSCYTIRSIRPSTHLPASLFLATIIYLLLLGLELVLLVLEVVDITDSLCKVRARVRVSIQWSACPVTNNGRICP